MSGVNAHMLLASPAACGQMSGPLAGSLAWERARFHPTPEALHLAAGFRKIGKDSCAFSFSVGAQTAYLAQNFVCGQLLMPASALLEAAAAAACTLREQLPRAALVGVVLPEQGTLPAQPAAAAFTCTVSSAAGGVTIREEGQQSKKAFGGVLLQAEPLVVAELPVLSWASARSALSDVTSRALNTSLERAVEPNSTATVQTQGISNDGYLSMPGVSAAALDLLGNAGNEMLAPTVLQATEAFLVSAQPHKASTSWIAAGAEQHSRSAGGSADISGELSDPVACFEAASFQQAKRAKQDAMEAAAGLVYDVEWQTFSPMAGLHGRATAAGTHRSSPLPCSTQAILPLHC